MDCMLSVLFQAFCMLFSSLIVVILGEAAVGGSEKVFKANFDAKRIELFNLDPSILTRKGIYQKYNCKK